MLLGSSTVPGVIVRRGVHQLVVIGRFGRVDRFDPGFVRRIGDISETAVAAADEMVAFLREEMFARMRSAKIAQDRFRTPAVEDRLLSHACPIEATHKNRVNFAHKAGSSASQNNYDLLLSSLSKEADLRHLPATLLHRVQPMHRGRPELPKCHRPIRAMTGRH